MLLTLQLQLQLPPLVLPLVSLAPMRLLLLLLWSLLGVPREAAAVAAGVRREGGLVEVLRWTVFKRRGSPLPVILLVL